jgi:hypothetical protein
MFDTSILSQFDSYDDPVSGTFFTPNDIASRQTYARAPAPPNAGVAGASAFGDHNRHSSPRHGYGGPRYASGRQLEVDYSYQYQYQRPMFAMSTHDIHLWAIVVMCGAVAISGPHPPLMQIAFVIFVIVLFILEQMAVAQQQPNLNVSVYKQH